MSSTTLIGLGAAAVTAWLVLRYTRSGSAGQRGVAGRVWAALVRWVVSPAAAFVASLVPRAIAGQTEGSPRTVTSRFVATLEAQYGARHPTFVAGTVEDALREARKQCRFLVVYLHSPLHPDTDIFCRQTLCSEPVVDFLDGNAVVWGADVSSVQGHQAAALLQAQAFPFFAVLYPVVTQPGAGRDRRRQPLQQQPVVEVRVFERFWGPLTVDELLARIMGAIEEHDAALAVDRLEREERERNRMLVQQQEQEYRESLLEDQLKEKRKKEDSSVNLADAKKAESDSNNDNSNNNSRSGGSSASRGNTPSPAPAPAPAPAVVKALPPEPEASEANVVHVALRLPNARVDRRFRLSDSLSLVFDFVDSSLSDAERGKAYRLVTAYPRNVFQRNAGVTLQEAGFVKKMALMYEEEE